MIKKLPLPIAGVMLALAATGNLIQSYSPTLRLLLGLLAAILGALLILKAIMYPKTILEDLKNPIIASVTPTFSMALMILSGYLKPISSNLGLMLWWFGFFLHSVLLIYFTIKFIAKFDINKVFPSFFIVYVGLAAASITAPAFGLANLGQVVFWFSFICYIILLVIISYRMLVIKAIPEPAKPLFIIYAAPASLCLVGYLSSFELKSIFIVSLLAILSIIMYLICLVKLVSLLKLKFYPSFSAFTFPMVISAIATKQAYAYLSTIGTNLSILKYLTLFQTIIAIIIVVYVVLKYIQFITNSNKVKNASN